MTEEREEYQALPEAPTTVNVRFYYHRFDVQFTIREHDVNKLWKKLTFLIETNLIPNPAVQPKFGNNAPSSEKPEAEAHPLKEPTEGQPAMAEPAEEFPQKKPCPIHPNQNLIRRVNSKTGQLFYSHKLGEDEWCYGKEK